MNSDGKTYAKGFDGHSVGYRSPEADAVSVWVEHVKFADTPGLIHWRDVDDGTVGDEFSVQRVYVVTAKAQRAADYSVARMRRGVEGHAVANEAHIGRVALRFACRNLEQNLKAELATIKRFCCIGAGDVEHGNDIL